MAMPARGLMNPTLRRGMRGWKLNYSKKKLKQMANAKKENANTLNSLLLGRPQAWFFEGNSRYAKNVSRMHLS